MRQIDASGDPRFTRGRRNSKAVVAVTGGNQGPRRCSTGAFRIKALERQPYGMSRSQRFEIPKQPSILGFDQNSRDAEPVGECGKRDERGGGDANGRCNKFHAAKPSVSACRLPAILDGYSHPGREDYGQNAWNLGNMVSDGNLSKLACRS